MVGTLGRRANIPCGIGGHWGMSMMRRIGNGIFSCITTIYIVNETSFSIPKTTTYHDLIFRICIFNHVYFFISFIDVESLKKKISIFEILEKSMIKADVLCLH